MFFHLAAAGLTCLRLAAPGLALPAAEAPMVAAPAPVELRPFVLSAAMGPAALLGPGKEALALTYRLVRLGVGLAPGRLVTLAFEGGESGLHDDSPGNPAWLEQSIWSLGLQSYFGARFYLRGGLGVGTVAQESSGQPAGYDWGIAGTGGLGYEVIQRRRLALALDLNGSYTQFPAEAWKTLGLQATLSFF